MDDDEGQVVVLSHWLWNDWFGRDANIVGQTIAVSGALRTIIGVLPQWFQFPDERTSVYLHDLITPPVQPGNFNLRLIGRLAPGAPVYRVFTMEQLADRSMARLSFTMLSLFIAAALALVLGAVGIYGTISYAVSRRTREIGIRMALGAQAADVRRMVVAQGSRIALIGVVIGLFAAMISARSLESLLYEVQARDPTVFATVAVVMLGVALLASYLPAKRASAVDPAEAIRVE